MEDLDRDIIRVAEKYGIPVKRYPNCITDKRAKKLIKKGRKKKKPTYRKWGNSTYLQIDDELSTSTGESCSSDDEKIVTSKKSDKETKKQEQKSSSTSSSSTSQPTLQSLLATPSSPSTLNTSKSQSPKDGNKTPTVEVDFILPLNSKVNQMAAVENKMSSCNVSGGVKAAQPSPNDTPKVNETSPELTKIEIHGSELTVIQSDIVCNCNRKFRTYPEYRIHKTRECELSFDSTNQF